VRGRQRVIAISGSDGAAGGVSVAGRWIVDDTDRLAQPVADLSRARSLPGAHNGQNAAAAYAAARALGVSAETAAKALLDFPGLAHRQEPVGTIRGVRYVNDSKATNAEAAARALESYDTIFWIAGGVPKEGGIASLAPFFPRIVHAFLIGQAAPDFGRTLDGEVPSTQCGDLATAVREARAAAERSPRRPAVVLLSPACASFDQFRDFEARGDAFRTIVAQLAAEANREGAAA
jgi:UDP-N-acetylmuramoylalanine--D-glutamate ligase